MEFIEKNPLPLVCQECIAEQDKTGEYDDCYNCDYALERWSLAPADELKIKAILEKKVLERKKKNNSKRERRDM